MDVNVKQAFMTMGYQIVNHVIGNVKPVLHPPIIAKHVMILQIGLQHQHVTVKINILMMRLTLHVCNVI